MIDKIEDQVRLSCRRNKIKDQAFIDKLAQASFDQYNEFLNEATSESNAYFETVKSIDDLIYNEQTKHTKTNKSKYSIVNTIYLSVNFIAILFYIFSKEYNLFSID